MSDWWYKDRGTQCGPVTQAQLLALVTQGQVGPDTQVWSRDSRSWQPLRRHGHLASGTARTSGAGRRLAGLAGVLALVLAGSAALYYAGQPASTPASLPANLAATAPDGAAQARPGATWTNPVTGRDVALARHWIYKTNTSDDGLTVHRFYLQQKGKLVVAVHEATDQDLAIYSRPVYADMQKEWDDARGALETFRSHPSWHAYGVRDGGALHIDLRLLKVDGGIWRVAVIERDPAQASDDVTDLTDRIWGSLASR